MRPRPRCMISRRDLVDWGRRDNSFGYDQLVGTFNLPSRKSYMTRCCGIARIVLSSTFGLLLSFTSAHAVETRVTAGAVDLSLSAPAIVPPGTAAGLSGKTEAALAQPIEIFYPGPAETADTRAGYYVSLLDLAMSKTGVRY